MQADTVQDFSTDRVSTVSGSVGIKPMLTKGLSHATVNHEWAQKVTGVMPIVEELLPCDRCFLANCLPFVTTTQPQCNMDTADSVDSLQPDLSCKFRDLG